MVVVSSLHWIDPEVRYAKLYELLKPGGIMAVAGCHWVRPKDAAPFWFEVQEDYLAVGYAGQTPATARGNRTMAFPARGSTLFRAGSDAALSVHRNL